MLLTAPDDCINYAPGHGTHWGIPLRSLADTPIDPAWITDVQDNGWFTVITEDLARRWWIHDINKLRGILDRREDRVGLVRGSQYVVASGYWFHGADEASDCTTHEALLDTALRMLHAPADEDLDLTVQHECARRLGGHFVNLGHFRRTSDHARTPVDVRRVLESRHRDRSVALIEVRLPDSSIEWFINHRMSVARPLLTARSVVWQPTAGLLRSEPGGGCPPMSVIPLSEVERYRRCRR